MLFLHLYRLGLRLFGPYFIARMLRRRIAGEKEDPARLNERYGISDKPRPDGPLIWFHGASMGEAISVMDIILRLKAEDPGRQFLMTTGSVTAANLVARRQAADLGFLIHQWAPLDYHLWVNRFLDHWRPDVAMRIESDIWPNMTLACAKRNIPLIMVNGRMAARSYNKWKKIKSPVAHLLNCYALLIAQDETTANYLKQLGAKNIALPGNLKLDAEPLQAKQAELDKLLAAIGSRPRWLAASTHPGEEDMAAEVHDLLADRHAGLLTLIAPRHPDRAGDILASLRGKGYKVAQRSKGELPDAETQIYLSDTLGEMGLFYRLGKAAFLGGTLAPVGGQNPLEATRLGNGVAFGPHIGAFPEIFTRLRENEAALFVENVPQLAEAIHRLMSEPELVETLVANADNYDQSMRGATLRTLELIAPYMPVSSAQARQENV